MNDVVAPRTALLAGATGLVGSALLPMLLAGKQYRSVHVLLRRAAPDIKADAKRWAPMQSRASFTTASKARCRLARDQR